MGSGAHIQGERPSLQQLVDQGPSPGAVAAPKSGLALDQRQLQGGGGHSLALQEVFDGALQPLGNNLQGPGGGMGAAQFDLTQKGPRKIVAGDGGQAEPTLVAGLANPGSELSRWGIRD